MTTFLHKSTIDEIRRRFDSEVERFSNLESGQKAAIDAPLVLELVAKAARTHLNPGARLVDLGCGAGNFALSVMQRVGPLDVVLVDLSEPMLARAQQRVKAAGALRVTTIQSDLRAVQLEEGSVDCILAGAVLHHLREDEDWRSVFAQLHQWLKPGGRVYVSDLVTFDEAAIQSAMWDRYGEYLSTLGGQSYRDDVFAYIEREDSPRSVAFQIELARSTGFTNWDILHRNSVFVCYYIKKEGAC